MSYKKGRIVKVTFAPKDFEIDKYIKEQWDKVVLQGELITYIIDKNGNYTQLKK